MSFSPDNLFDIYAHNHFEHPLENDDTDKAIDSFLSMHYIFKDFEEESLVKCALMDCIEVQQRHAFKIGFQAAFSLLLSGLC